MKLTFGQMRRLAVFPFAITMLCLAQAAAAQNLFVSDFGNGNIDEVTPGGNVSTFLSGFSQPTGLAFDSNGNLYIGAGTQIDEATPGGTVSTFATGFG